MDLNTVLSLTEKQLDEKVHSLLGVISSRPLTREEEPCEEERLEHVKLIAEWIIRNPVSRDSVLLFVALVGELKSLAPEYENALMTRMFDVLKSGRVGELGFRSQDLEVMNASYMAYHITHQETPAGICRMQVFSDRGQSILSSQGLWLLDNEEKVSEKQLGGKSVSLGINDWIYVASGQGGARLKKDQTEDIRAIDRFVLDYTAEMREQTRKVKLKQHLLAPEKGDTLMARIVSNDGLSIRVRIQESGYHPIEGMLVFQMSSVLYHRPSEFYQALMPGDYIRVQVIDPAAPTFSLEKPFVRYIVEDARQNDLGYSCHCRYIEDSPNGMVWMSVAGIPIYTAHADGFSKGDFADVEVDEVHDNGVIHGIKPTAVEDTFDVLEAARNCVLDFRLEDVDLPSDNVDIDDVATLDPVLIRLLIRQLFILQKRQPSASERCRILAVARIMAEMVHDDEAKEYMAFVAKYLWGVSSFLSGDMDPVRNLSLVRPKVCANTKLLLQRQGTIQLLQKWGMTDLDTDEFLHDAADDFREEIPALSQMARLIRTSNELMSLVSGASVNVLKREIFRLLHLDEAQSLLDTQDSLYLGVESSTQEFKESIVFPPGNQMQPDQKTQEFNVMKGICAFLNSKTGGTLYLGVTDEGAVKGIASDMKFLKVKNEDTFMRVHIQDAACRLMGKEVLPYIELSLAYDNRVVAIKVSPFPYDLVRLDGKAYIRVNAESREMSAQMEARLLHEKRSKNTALEEKIILLNEGKTKRLKVRLCQYASSNSGTFSDRLVEAYDILPNEGVVGTIDEKDLKVKVFKINRIGHVEITDVPWNHVGLHQIVKSDPFHMTGTNPIHCTLRLNMRAYNLLIEEYPATKLMLTPDKSAEEPHWILDVDVYNLVGIGRFYMGLAHDIEVLNAPELAAYAKSYIERLAARL